MFDCLFCKNTTQSKAIGDYPHCFVINDEFPVSNGHVLIIPKKHIHTWFDADEEIKQEIMKVIDIQKSILDQKLRPDGYNIGMNCGAAAGQTVMHMHVHLIPRYSGDVENPRGGVRGVIPSKQKY